MKLVCMDKISLDRIQTLHPAVRESATSVLAEATAALTGKAIPRFAFTFRSFSEQEALYAQGRTTKGSIVTNARPGYSYHNYGLAFDIVLIINGKEASWDMRTDFDGDAIPDWMEVVKIAKAHGWVWGGDWKSFKDYPHFEKTFGYTEKQLLEKYNKKDFISGTGFVNISVH